MSARLNPGIYISIISLCESPDGSNQPRMLLPLRCCRYKQDFSSLKEAETQVGEKLKEKRYKGKESYEDTSLEVKRKWWYSGSRYGFKPESCKRFR